MVSKKRRGGGAGGGGVFLVSGRMEREREMGRKYYRTEVREATGVIKQWKQAVDIR